MNERGKSDSLIVPGKLPNKGCGALQPAEGVEGRGLAEGNPVQQTRLRTQSRNRPATCVGTDTAGSLWPARHYPR
jgi:hypothetical protein